MLPLWAISFTVDSCSSLLSLPFSFYLSLSLILQRSSHEGGSHLKVQPNVSNRGRDVPEEEHSLFHSLSNTSFSPRPPPPPSTPLQFIISPLPTEVCCLASWDWRPNNDGVVWYHRLPEGVEAAERLSSKPKHLYSVIHLITPHPSILLPSASLSIIHLALISLPVCQRGSAKMSAAWRGVCILCVYVYVQYVCVWVSVCVLLLMEQKGRWFISWEKGCLFKSLAGFERNRPAGLERACHWADCHVFLLLLLFLLSFSPFCFLKMSLGKRIRGRGTNEKRTVYMIEKEKMKKM